MSNTNKGTSSGVYLTNPDNSYSPYTASNPQPAGIGGFTDIANNSTFKRALIDSNGHLQVDIVSGGGGGGGDATAANQTTMISSLSNIDTAVSGTLFVSDSNAQTSLANIDTAVTGTLSVSDGTAQSSLSNIDTAVNGTLAVSAAALPLPSGAATSAAQSSANASLATLAGAVAGSEVQVDIVSAPTLNVSDSTAQGSLSTLAGAVVGSEVQVDIVSAPTLNVADSTAQGSLATLAGAVVGSELQVDIVSSATVPVSAASLPLPSGAATSAAQSSANASLATIAACENGANALQVDIQADAVGLATGTKQDNIITQLKSDFHTNNVMNAQAIGTGSNATSSVHDFGADKIPRDFTGVLIQLTDSAAGGGSVQIEGSFDNSTFHNLGYSTSFYGSGLFALGEFLSYLALPRYIRFVVQNDGGSSSNFSVDVGYYRS